MTTTKPKTATAAPAQDDLHEAPDMPQSTPAKTIEQINAEDERMSWLSFAAIVLTQLLLPSLLIWGVLTLAGYR